MRIMYPSYFLPRDSKSYKAMVVVVPSANDVFRVKTYRLVATSWRFPFAWMATVVALAFMIANPRRYSMAHELAQKHLIDATFQPAT